MHWRDRAGSFTPAAEVARRPMHVARCAGADILVSRNYINISRRLSAWSDIQRAGGSTGSGWPFTIAASWRFRVVVCGVIEQKLVAKKRKGSLMTSLLANYVSAIAKKGPCELKFKSGKQ